MTLRATPSDLTKRRRLVGDWFRERGDIDLDQGSGRARGKCPAAMHALNVSVVPLRFVRGSWLSPHQRKNVMKKLSMSFSLVLLVMSAFAILTPARAETGRVAVIFTKGGFVLGVGGGEGVLTLRNRHYPFTVSGMSVGFTIGASTTKFVGRAFNLRGPASIEGTYSTAGAGGAVAAGAGTVQLQNANGVILQLSGPRVGAEVSAAIGGVTIRLK